MKQITRRALIAAASLATAAIFAPVSASAQSDEPITLVVPYGGGGLVDGVVREVADMMSQDLDRPVLVENKPGANGIVGASYVANAEPDGTTFLVGATGPLSLNVLLRPNLPYGLDDFEPVATMFSGPLTVTVPTAMNVSSMDELKAYAEESGKPLRYATLGPGSVTHLFGLILEEELGVEMVDVAYRNNPAAIVDLLGGQNDLNFSTPISLVKHEEAGDLKMMAITTPERMEQFPDLPTTTELGHPKLVSSFWFGLVAPAGTPQESIDAVAAATEKAMNDTALQERLTKVGMIPEPGGPESMQAQLDDDQEVWGTVVKENNITLD